MTRLHSALRRGNAIRVGFTMLEVIVVLTILASIVLIVAPSVPLADSSNRQDDVMLDSCRTALVEQRVVTAVYVRSDSIVCVSCFPTGLVVSASMARR